MKEGGISMSATSVTGPDDMSGRVYQAYWDVISNDLLEVV